ncbi:MAG: HlyD family type I secretion periplasmic adaptor subunit [Pseudomonadota bacterium]
MHAYLALPLDIESGMAARLCRRVIVWGSIVFVALVAISAVATIKEVAIAEGEIATETPPVIVEHLEGGSIAELFVQPGDRVQKDQALAKIAPVAAEADLAQAQVRRAHLVLQRERLRALIDGRPPMFGELQDRYPGLALDQEKLFVAESKAVAAAAAAISAEVAQREQEIMAAEQQRDSLAAQIEINQQQATIREELLARGFTSQVAALETRAALEQVRADFAEALRTLTSAVRAIADARSRGAQTAAERAEVWSQDIARLSGEIAEIDQTILQVEDRVSRLIVRTPAAGRVQDVVPKGVGETLAPGDAIATIIPGNATLIADVRLNPDDVGHIAVGHRAEINVTTFDEAVFGTIDGVVKSVSPTTFPDPERGPFFSVRIALEDTTLRSAGGDVQLSTGMLVRAEILSGERSILRYLFKPIARAFDRAFNER